VSIISYDYRGYGLHEGVPTEPSCYADIDGVYEMLTNDRRSPPQRIILYGRSIGSGPTCYLGQRLSALAHPDRSWFTMPLLCHGTHADDDSELPSPSLLPSGFILQSPIASAIRVVSNILAMLPIDIFTNINRIAKIDIPTLIIHGTNDEVVPYVHGCDLYNRARRPYKVLFAFIPCFIQAQFSPHPIQLVSLEGAGHNNIEADYMKQLLAEMHEFLCHLEMQQVGPEDNNDISSASHEKGEEDD